MIIINMKKLYNDRYTILYVVNIIQKLVNVIQQKFKNSKIQNFIL